jgi:cellulose synthase/poly-beta-1,6-N-acetylglucosamine synthase-like glycosyltransferase/putative flippase GtrA
MTLIADGPDRGDGGNAQPVTVSPGRQGLWQRVVGRHDRKARFVVVGGVCFTVQFLILEALVHLGVGATGADVVGFAVSAQLNFALSSVVTWGDRRPSGRRAWLYRGAGYNATALISLLVNGVVFGLVHQRLGHLLSAAVGVLAGMVVTYLVCNFVIFRAVGRSAPAAGEADAGPGDQPMTTADAGRKEAGARPPRVLSLPQKVAFVLGSAGFLTALIKWPLVTVVLTNAALTIFFVAANVMKLVLIRWSMDDPSGTDPSLETRIPDDELPIYTILLPVYHEASVLQQLVKGIERLDYPEDRLDVKLLLELNDTETREAAEQVGLPACFDVLLIPDVGPTGKPRACNHGLAHARGEYLVIYDAEDRPEPDQLRKAVAAFWTDQDDAVCYQAKLNYFNRTYNLLTRWFTAEYSVWFDKLLPGLQAMDVAIPLGGTSNHFITNRLRELGGWDAYNVTEDAELGMRIFLHGCKTSILDSTTYEEATSRAYNWTRQRSRWVKGYMQTYLLYMRRPFRLVRQMGPKAFVAFQLFFGAGTLCLLLNPVYWLLTMTWYLTHLAGIESVFPMPILYIGSIGLFLGNVAFTLANLSGCFAREYYDDVKWALLSPVYWVMMSVAAWKAAIQLCYKPHYWEKTVHGFCTFDDSDGHTPAAEAAMA